jgi:glycosyltransferase 2 family protein
MSKALRGTLAAAVSVVALWLAMRNAHLAELRSALGRASFVWLLPYPLFCVALNLLRGEIWRRFLERRVTTIQAFWAYSIGFLANNVLPFRIGEAVRVVVLATRCRLPIVEVGAAAGLERLLDLAALALLLAAVAPAVAHLPAVGGGAALVVAGVAAGVAAVGILVRWRAGSTAAIARVAARLPGSIGPAIVARWNDLERGLATLFEPSIGIPTAAGAIVVWSLTVVSQWLVLRAFQPQAALVDAGFMIAAVSLAIALPAAPGFVGVYHWAGQQALIAAFPQRYDASTALAAATAAHAVSYLTSTALGLIGLWYFGMRPAALKDARHGGGRPGISTGDSRHVHAESLATRAL